VAAPKAHRARANLVVLGAATYDGANLHMKLEQWLTQFRAWFSPTALTSTAPPAAAAFLATTPIFMRFITPPAAAAVSAKDRKRKAAEGPDDPATITAKAAAAALKQRQKATGTSTTATTVVPAQLSPTSIPEVSQPSKLKAKTPLVCWTVSGKAKYPQGIGQMIYSSTKDPLISLPTIEEHHICFPYIIDATGIGYGCDGTIKARPGKLIGRKPCRHHIDISTSTDGCSKAILQPLWTFLQITSVKGSLVPTPALSALMA